MNYPEAVALVSSQMQERIRDGVSVAELMSAGKKLLGRRQVLSRGLGNLMVSEKNNNIVRYEE